MKFSWKANWEILLVLVIIAVGIVITTIAAIKNRDKHFVALAEESDQFGHIGRDPQTGGSMGGIAINGGASFNTDLSSQQTNDAAGGGGGYLNSFGTPQQVAPINDNQLIPTANDNNANTNHHHDLAQSIPAHHNQRGRAYQQQKSMPIHSIIGSADNPLTSGHLASSSKPNGLRQQQSTKFDDLQMDGMPPPGSHNQLVGMMQPDAFDAALGTDPTPSQVRLNSRNHQHRFRNPSPADLTFNQNNNNNKPNGNTDESSATTASTPMNPLDMAAGLDDIHTTRSSMGAFNNNQNNNLDTGGLDSGDHQLILLKQATNPKQPAGGSTSNVLDDPDDQLMNSQFVRANNNQHQFHHQQQHQPPSSMNSTNQFNPAMMTNMLTSMSPLNQNGDQNPSDLSSYQPGTTTSQANQQQQHQLNSPANQQQQQHQLFRGPFSGSLPISMLFNDILKLARPLHQTQNHRNQQQQQQQQQDSGRGSQQQPPAPQTHQLGGGILQQLKSLPSPLLSLLQSLTPGGQAAASQANSINANINNNNNGQFINNEQQQQLMNQFMLANHDASESSHHFRKLLPSDINALLARSMRSAQQQPPVLPAFPAPKGYSEKRWTQGESPDIFHSSMNTNADFVASNAAGFVRQQQQQQQASSAPKSDSSSASSDNVNQQQTQQDQSPSSIPLGANARAIAPAVTNTQLGPATQQQVSAVAPDQHQQHHHQSWNHEQQQAPRIDPQNPSSSLTPSSFIENNAKQMQTTNNNQPPPIYHSGPIALGAQQQQQQNQLYNQQHATGVPNYQQQQHQLLGQQVALGFNQDQQVALGHLAQQNQQQQHQMMLSPMLLMDGSKHRPSITLAPQQQHHPQPVQSQQQQQIMSSSKLNVAQQQQAKPQQVPTGASLRKKRSSPYSDNDDTIDRALHNDEEMMNQASSSWPEQRVAADGEESLAAEGSRDAEQRPLPRSVSRRSTREQHAAEESGSSGEQDENEDDEGDDPPMVVVSPDGRPMEAGDETMRRRHNQHHQRRVTPVVASPPNRLTPEQQQQGPMETASSGLMSKLLLGTASTNDELEDELDNDDDESASEKRKEEIEDAEFGIVTNKARRRQKQQSADNRKKSSASSNKQQLQGKQENKKNKSNKKNKTKSSALGPYHMLTGSVADEQARRLKASSMSQSNNKNDDITLNKINSGNNLDGASEKPAAGLTGEADDASASYARRQQQRADVEFYGHPGEETRQLKYGILGSGNYEIVNGGVYVENDELAAAVNSVANYVRKPGGHALVHGSAAQSLALALPRLLKASAAAAAAANVGGGDALRLSSGAPPVNNQQHHISNGARDAQFGMAPVAAGGRLNAAGLLRDASAVLADSERLHPLSEHRRDKLAGIDTSPPGEVHESVRQSNHGSLGTSPLLDLIYDAHNSIDSGLLSQLGSTTRIVHDTSSDPTDSTNNNKSSKQSNENEVATGSSRSRQELHGDISAKNRQSSRVNTIDTDQDRHDDNNQEKHSTINTSKDKHQNDQFNSYVISPSKKVTIFSDRDLDSAPSELAEEAIAA